MDEDGHSSPWGAAALISMQKGGEASCRKQYCRMRGLAQMSYLWGLIYFGGFKDVECFWWKRVLIEVCSYVN
ncbi:hypothetical protein CEXT_319301 [Caerostris extrusa]|uniref:Uncharacterized protein n=1 Tax=Caerostris extrusa TaxID=172846 RepID=A0AAV4R400_CAEEX|nr:hypothetical protein CEXT_319301 [Caerostris extrusa]